jgi:crotonobetainyl-CoA:carnitine CoA-transferase CaiB-like acyl-CoA transferase
LLDAIVNASDVVVQNLQPGAAARLGLDAATLRRRRPELIHCSISGYGDAGPYRMRKAYDLLIQCEVGLVAATGTSDETCKVGISVADIAAGMYAFSGILTALLRRATQGVGSTVDVAMIDALGEWMTQPAYLSEYGGAPTRRTAAKHASIAPYGPYRVGDGNTVFLGVQNDREWTRMCEHVLARPELADDPRFIHNEQRVRHDDVLTELLEAAFVRLTAEQVVALLDEVGIACAQLRSPHDLLAHPQLIARDRWRDVTTPGGIVRALVPPVCVVGQEPAMGAVPRLGQHNDRLRIEFGGRAAAVDEGSI